MGKSGHDVTLIHPNIWTGIEGDIWGYYNVEKSFAVERIRSFDALSARWIPGFLAFAIGMWSYRRALREFFKSYPTDIFYCRSWEVLDPILETHTRTILELHTLPRHGLRKFVEQCNRCWKVVCLTSPMWEEVVRMGVERDRIIVEGDGVVLERFSDDVVKKFGFTKAQCELPERVPIIGYVGSFVTQNNLEKGINELIESLVILKKENKRVFGWIVGGIDRDDYYSNKAESCKLKKDIDFQFYGPVFSQWVPSVLSLCDICVYPAPRSTHPYFMRDTSPLKLFEYLASEKPIVCADLPPIRDIVDEATVTFSVPGDPKSLADAIAWVLEHPAEAQEKARKGREHVKRFDWGERMKRILRN